MTLMPKMPLNTEIRLERSYRRNRAKIARLSRNIDRYAYQSPERQLLTDKIASLAIEQAVIVDNLSLFFDDGA